MEEEEEEEEEESLFKKTCSAVLRWRRRRRRRRFTCFSHGPQDQALLAEVERERERERERDLLGNNVHVGGVQEVVEEEGNLWASNE